MRAQGDKLYSEMFNELYQFNMETRRWFPMVVRAKARAGKDGAANGPTEEHVQEGDTVDSAGGAPATSDAAPAAPAFLSALQQHANDPQSAFYRAAQRIQANFRGFVVRKVRRCGSCCLSP